MFHGSIHRKTTVLIVGGGIVSAIMTVACAVALESRRSAAGARAQIDAIMTLASREAAAAAVSGDPRAARRLLQTFQAAPYVHDAALYNAGGACLAAIHQCRTAGTKDLSAALPLTDAGARVGTLVLIAGSLTHEGATGEYRLMFPWILAVSLGVALAIAVLVRSKISAPILGIGAIAERIAQTHSFDERVPLPVPGELRALAGSVNSLLDEIHHRDGERAEDRRRLEQQIEEHNRVHAELRFAIEKAEEASRLKGQFLANMSHEIRTPMNGILGFTQLCLNTRLTEDQRDYLDTVERSAEFLMQLLNDILDVSKIEAGKMELDREPFSVRECVEDSTRTLLAAAHFKGLTLSCEIDPRIPDSLIGDQNRIRQVLLNLVGNAIKFTDEGGVRVAVGMEPAPDSSLVAHFAVCDTGPGIPEDKRRVIFEPFRQADGSTSRRYGGTGLGLAISTGLVDIMGGRIWVESEVGCGSTFHFTAPLALAATPMPQRSAMPANSPESEQLSILVAEDNVVSQRLVMALLRERGHNVTLAATGCEAVELVEKRDFDLVLMDIQMPEMDGLQATAEIRGREGRKGGHIPIIAMTAHAMAGDRERCLGSGMDGYIAKPIHPAELMALITGISAQRIAAVSIQGAA